MAFPVQARAGACDSWTRSLATAARLNPSGKNDSGVACVLLGCNGAPHAMCRTTVAIDTGARRQRCQGVVLRYWCFGHSKKSVCFFDVRCFCTRCRMRVRRCPIHVFFESSLFDANRINGCAGVTMGHGNVEGALSSGQLAASGRSGGCRIRGSEDIPCRKSCAGVAFAGFWSGGPRPTLCGHCESSYRRLAAPPALRSTAAVARWQVAQAFSSRESCARRP